MGFIEVHCMSNTSGSVSRPLSVKHTFCIFGYITQQTTSIYCITVDIGKCLFSIGK